MRQNEAFVPMLTRYDFDFGDYQSRFGWAQVDTCQDAAWFGVWINPEGKAVTSFCEGELVCWSFEEDQEFSGFVRDLINGYRENGYRAWIDGMCRDNIINEFKRLGLGNLLH